MKKYGVTIKFYLQEFIFIMIIIIAGLIGYPIFIIKKIKETILSLRTRGRNKNNVK